MGSKPKIIFWDLETLPDLQEVLKIFPSLSDYPGRTLKATICSIICFGWREYGKKKTHCINAWDFPSWDKNVNDDKKLIELAYEILKDADCVVTFNGKKFDWRFFQTRLLKHGLDPLNKIRHVDLYQIAKSNLFLYRNNLNSVADLVAKAEKLKHEGWDLWVKVHNKDQKAMNKMERYCKKDVTLLEPIFEKLRPYINDIPNYNLYNEVGDKICPRCGHWNIIKHGFRRTKTRTYRRYMCNNCGSVSRTDSKDILPRS